MKKILSVLFSLVLVSLFVLVPVSASSPETFDPPFLNSNPSYMSFTLSSNTPDFRVSYSDYGDYLVSNGSGTYFLCVYVMCLDQYFRILDYNVQFQVQSLQGSTVIGTLNSSLSIDISEDFFDSRRTYDLQFIVSDPSVYYVCIIPFDTFSDQGQGLAISSYNSFYNRSIAGYTYGYEDGLKQGRIEGYNSVDIEGIQRESRDRGYAEGFEDGEDYGISISDPDEMLPAITDATMKVVSFPFEFISGSLNFNVFGVNIASLFFTLITLLILGFILKRFI